MRRGLPLGTAYLLQTTAACLLALGIAGIGAFAWLIHSTRAGLATRLESVASLAATRAAEPARAGNARSAAAVLEAVVTQPGIASARIELANGVVLSDVHAPGIDQAAELAASTWLGATSVEQPILRAAAGPTLGTLILVSTVDATRGPLVQGAALLAASLCVALGAAIVVLRRSRERLLAPILGLSHAVSRIVTVGDLRVRAEVPSQPELAALTRAVNDLLDRLSRHDDTLRHVTTNAERDIARRSREASAEVARHRRAVKEFILQKAAAEEASMAKSTFLFNMSHELRTPLNAIMGYSEILKEDAEDQGAAQSVSDLDKILAAGRHLLTLITDVLDLSKIEAGRMELVADTFDVGALLDDVTATSEALAATDQNALLRGSFADLGTMHSDPTKIRQILLNLLGNACKFTSHGTISVEAVRERELADWIVICVRDTGMGMTEDEQAALFREFSQGQFSRQRAGSGSGLGLAISQGLCHLLGGTIDVESRAGEGSLFTVRLPAELPPTARRAPDAESGGDADAERQVGRAVLVIDPDPGSRELAGRSVARLGYELLQASNAEEGLALAVRHEPVAIVVEPVLPGQNGWRLVERLTRTYLISDIPVVVVSSSPDRARSLSLGASEHLDKPVPTERLYAELRTLATRRAEPRLDAEALVATG